MTEPLKKYFIGAPCLRTPRLYVFPATVPDSRLLVGDWRHEYVEEEAGYTDVAMHGIQNALEGFIKRYFPEASDAKTEAR